jgi:multiple sugar transport system permease protein
MTAETLPARDHVTVRRRLLPRRRRLTPLERREARQGLLFLSPWLIGFVLFTLAPMIATLVLSVTNLDLSRQDPFQFVGLKNYQDLASDPRVVQSLSVTFIFAAIWLPVTMIVPFVVALMLNSSKLRGASFFRVLIFLPYVVPFVAGALIWQSMLLVDSGWLDQALRAIGIANPPNWLEDPSWIYPGLVLVGIWAIGGAVIVNLAGLKGVPSELYDAARIDGAGWWGQLRHVTLPLMSPVIFYSLTLGVVEVMQYFLVPFVLKNGTGEPGGSTLFFNLYIYKSFFTFQRMSYGATLAWILFVITLIITVALFASARKWVYYAAER